MPRIVAISDTHGLHKKLKLPDGDILVHSGDISMRGDIDEVQRFVDWVDTLLNKGKYKDVVWICGNHDFLFEENPTLARDMVKVAGHYLQDSSVTVQGLKFYGSPWQPEFYDWAFNLPRGNALKIMWDKIPTDTDVLITHGPPYLIQDDIFRKTRTKYDPVGLVPGHVGCWDLAKAVERIKPKAHIFGHIHEAYGEVKVGDTLYVNASTCTYSYDPENEPIVFDL
jgi:Icc-related predicted phosphoesterase